MPEAAESAVTEESQDNSPTSEIESILEAAKRVFVNHEPNDLKLLRAAVLIIDAAVPFNPHPDKSSVRHLSDLQRLLSLWERRISVKDRFQQLRAQLLVMQVNSKLNLMVPKQVLSKHTAAAVQVGCFLFLRVNGDKASLARKKHTKNRLGP